MHISVFETAGDIASVLGRRVTAALREHPSIVLGLPTGRTPVPLYAELRRLHAGGDADFSRASTFNLDEFAGIAPSHPGSFRHFMETHLFGHVNLSPARIHFLDGTAPDLDAECVRYEQEIASHGGIDLQILGIGANGHIGFNEPGDTLTGPTHRVTLAATTRRDNAAPFDGDPARVPREALSMGMATILKATTLVLVAIGDRKAKCIERTVNGPITTQLPASFLQLHRNAELYLDLGAARLL